MKIKQLSELLNVDIRKIARQKFKKDLNVRNISVIPAEHGDYRITVVFDGETGANQSLGLDYDCHGHLIKVLE